MRGVAAVVAFLLVAGSFGSIRAETCHDWDGDLSIAGWTCPSEEDCADRSYARGPTATELCDGLENDCDPELDLGCDRFCETPTLSPLVTELAWLEQETESGCALLTDVGFLATAIRLDGAEEKISARAYDRSGIPWGGPGLVTEPAPEMASDRYCELADAGDRALAVWIDAHSGSQSSFQLRARVTDLMAGPFGAAPIDLSATRPAGQGAPWFYHAAVWDGERFDLFWTAYGHRTELLMSIVHADGQLGTPSTIVVTQDVDGRRSTVQEVRAVWTGAHFLVATTVDRPAGEPNLFVLRVARDGTVLARSSVPDRAANLRMVRGNDRVMLGWTDTTAATIRVRAAMTDQNGTYLSVPGLLTLRSQSKGSDNSGKLRMTWSGEMFGVAWASFALVGSDYRFKWYFWRLLESGQILDPGGVLLSSEPGLQDVQSLHWAGEDFWLFATRKDPLRRLVRQAIVCSCDDADADSFDACTERDCDDSDPAAHPLGIEVCRGLRDEDCDGLPDCSDPDCPAGPGPGEISDLRWDGAAVAWSSVPGAERYDLARGLFSDLQRRGDLLVAECSGRELSSTSWIDDGRTPPPGEGIWYLVRPEGSPCALGTWGPASQPRDLTACR